MTEQEKLRILLAHILAKQENEIQYLKATVMEKLHISIDELQREQEEFWTRTKNLRVYETLKTFHTLQQEVDALPQGLTLDMYLDHLRWPSDPPEEKQ